MHNFWQSSVYRPVLLAGICLVSAIASAQDIRKPSPTPRNPYLAQSDAAMAHRNSAQQDNSSLRGPEGPTRVLSEDDIEWFFTGPGHPGVYYSSPDPDGQRIGWTSSYHQIVKFDHQTQQILASYPLVDTPPFTEAQADAALAAVYNAAPEARPMTALQLTARLYKELVGIYSLVDRDGDFYVGDHTGITVYGSANPDDPRSPIVVKRKWQTDQAISGSFIGINMTFDGRIVLVSEGGDVFVIARDFSEYHYVKLDHSDNSAAYLKRAEQEGRQGYTWVRNSYPVDENGGIYVLSAGYVHKVVWTGQKLSVDAADGAWSEPYPDSSGWGSGATPALMGFGPGEDHLIAFTDGDSVMNVVTYWRDDIPDGWTPPKGAPSRRMAGMVRADMGDPKATEVQTEQATVVAGYGALVVNNAPASLPAGLPARAGNALVGLLGTDPRFTPHGMQKILWDPDTRTLRLAWTSQIASPNVVPFISLGSNLAYTMGARDGQWTLEGVNWTTGKSEFHYTLPDQKYNGFYSAVMQDDDGHIVFGTPFGRGRIRR